MIKKILNNTFRYKEVKEHEFILPNTSNNIPTENEKDEEIPSVFPTLSVNLDYIKIKYNLLINGDIKLREFTLTIKSKQYSACILYIDGMVNNESINNFILQPLLLINSIRMEEQNTITSAISKNLSVKTVKKFDLEEFIYNGLIPQNSISKETKFDTIISRVNSGFCILFVDTLNSAFCIETKGFEGRSVAEPVTETIIKGPQEAFVEGIRVNTSLIRKVINNENLIIEELPVGNISKTPVAICYMKNIANDDLVAETKFRINNLNIDYLLSTGQLEQLIQDNPNTAFPQIVSTERPDRACSYLLNGRVVILVNGSPFAMIVPAIFIDFLSSSEDSNLNYHYANFLHLVRGIALFIALLLPGLYLAITNYHQEIIPSELLFAIVSAREAIPFPVLLEIVIMEFSFELILEAGLRASSVLGSTIGIIGGLILGEAAVSANLVSPLLIIIIAITGLCGFAIPDFSLKSSLRIFRFMYIILGYIGGFLGIALGFFIHFSLLANLSSFGVPYFTPYIPFSNLSENADYIMRPVWKRERRSAFLNTKRPVSEKPISMDWRKNEQ